MKVLIIGLGSIAQKHIIALREIDANVEVYALRSKYPAMNMEGIHNLYDWDEVNIHKFDFMIIASPSSLHLEHLIMASKSGIPIMLEKPLFISKDQIENWNRFGHQESIIYVACNLRFHPIIRFLKTYIKTNSDKINEINVYCGSYLPDWRTAQDYTKSYSANSKLGGGVHLDLVHEPDYIVYLFGLPKSSRILKNKVSNLIINSIDYSNILFEYEGFNVQITLNYYRRDIKRTLEIVREKDTLFADFSKNTIIDLVTGTELFNEPDFSIMQTYKDQIKYFMECSSKSMTPMNSIDEAITILDTIL